MAKLADAPDLGSGALRHGGSSPFARTTTTPEQTQIEYHKFVVPESRNILRNSTMNDGKMVLVIRQDFHIIGKMAAAMHYRR